MKRPVPNAVGSMGRKVPTYIDRVSFRQRLGQISVKVESQHRMKTVNLPCLHLSSSLSVPCIFEKSPAPSPGSLKDGICVYSIASKCFHARCLKEKFYRAYIEFLHLPITKHGPSSLRGGLCMDGKVTTYENVEALFSSRREAVSTTISDARCRSRMELNLLSLHIPRRSISLRLASDAQMHVEEGSTSYPTPLCYRSANPSCGPATTVLA